MIGPSEIHDRAADAPVCLRIGLLDGLLNWLLDGLLLRRLTGLLGWLCNGLLIGCLPARRLLRSKRRRSRYHSRQHHQDPNDPQLTQTANLPALLRNPQCLRLSFRDLLGISNFPGQLRADLAARCCKAPAHPNRIHYRQVQLIPLDSEH